MLPGRVTRIKNQFSPPPNQSHGDRTIRYVWHCHILWHRPGGDATVRDGDCPTEICEPTPI